MGLSDPSAYSGNPKICIFIKEASFLISVVKERNVVLLAHVVSFFVITNTAEKALFSKSDFRTFLIMPYSDRVLNFRICMKVKLTGKLPGGSPVVDAEC